MLEVEIKASLAEIPADQLTAAAQRLGFSKGDTLKETDVYFNSSYRSFTETDQALRLRSVKNLDSGEEETLITYKGPKIDKNSNTRREYETQIGDLSVMTELLRSLGFEPVFTVEKTRQEWKLPAAGSQAEVTLCLDQVKDLGAYMELETLVDDGGDKQPAVDRLLSLLDQFDVPRENLTRTSYLEMLFMAQKSQG